MNVPEFIQEMKRRGHDEEIIRKVVYDNPLTFFRQSQRWQDWDAKPQAAKSSKITRHRESRKTDVIEKT
jgi:hypothetical protein